jgi:hypothetical protein
MGTPQPTNADPLQGKGFGLMLILLIIIGVALTGYEYWRSTQQQAPPPPKPAPATPAPPIAVTPANPQDALDMPAGKRQRVDLLIFDALMPPVQKTEAGVIADFGTPRRIETKSVPNAHVPSKPDQLRTLVYDGMTMSFLRVTNTGGELPAGMVVTGKTWVVKWYLGVGATEKLILDTLGTPKARTAATLTYVYSLAPSTTTFHLANGTVTKVVWEYYID